MDGEPWEVEMVDAYAPEYTDILGHKAECECGSQWVPSPKALWMSHSCTDEEWNPHDEDNPQDPVDEAVALAKFKKQLRDGAFDRPSWLHHKEED
jgi:hypothetical protein